MSQPHKLSVQRRCQLLRISRSSAYYQRQETPSADDLRVMYLIDKIHTKLPFYGSRRLVGELADHDIVVNRKRVQRLMRIMGIQALYPKPNTSKANEQHKVYPYLLRDLKIDRSNQVWATDITYIPMPKGWLYLVAIMDWHSRKVLSWRLSNSLDTAFCIEALEEAIERFGRPQIFNTDQGCQFTSEAFTGVLKANDIRISMDGKGRWVDNVFVERLWRSLKYEEVYLKSYATVAEAKAGIGWWFGFYNQRRKHTSLDKQTPDTVYFRDLDHSPDQPSEIISKKAA